MKQLYVIEYENAHWCGGQLHCVVWADSEDQAQDIAGYFMDETQYDLFSDHYEDDPDADDGGCYSTVNSVELLEDSDIKEFYADPEQRAAFYPCVNEEDMPL